MSARAFSYLTLCFIVNAGRIEFEDHSRVSENRFEGKETNDECNLASIGSGKDGEASDRLGQICLHVAQDVHAKDYAVRCDSLYPSGTFFSSDRAPCCNKLYSWLHDGDVDSFLIVCGALRFAWLKQASVEKHDILEDEPIDELPDMQVPKERVTVEHQDLVTVQRNTCLVLNNPENDDVTGLPAELDALRQKDKVPGSDRSLADQLFESFGCSDTSSEDLPLKAIAATGKSGSDAMKTLDGKFRLKVVLHDEYEFWRNRGAGDVLVHHWHRNPLTAMAKYYAMVNSNTVSAPRYWVIMLNAFAGIKDMKEDPNGYIYDLKGSNRLCKGTETETCGKELEAKEQNFDANFRYNGLSILLGAWPAADRGESIRGGYNRLMKALKEDVEILRQLEIHDYSLVARVTTTAPECPGGLVHSRWHDNLDAWSQADKFWKGAGSEFCALGSFTTPVRVTMVLLDYLQDSTTLHNRMAGSKLVKGSKVPASRYADRFMDYMLSCFRPIIITEKSAAAQYGTENVWEYDEDLEYQSTLCYDKLINGKLMMTKRLDPAEFQKYCRLSWIDGETLQGGVVPA